MNRVVVIGSGVIGAFAAYYLAKRQYAVTVVDKGRFGAGASAGNCGLIVPDHILPLNDPATLLKVIGWLFKEDAPLHVKPQLDPALIKWFLNFALGCHAKAIYTSATGRHALLQSSQNLYPDFIETDKIDCDWTAKGAIHAYPSHKEWSAFGATAAWLSTHGIAVEKLDAQALRQKEPALSKNLAGGWYYPKTVHLQPEGLLRELKLLLNEKGVRILENEAVVGFNLKKKRALGVRTTSGVIPADTVVVATGAWTPLLAKGLGCRIPIQPGKGYSMTMPRPRNSPRIPIFLEGTGVVVTPWSDRFRIGGTMEFAGYDERLNRRRLDALARGAERLLSDFRAVNIPEEWCGFRPMTFDGLPIIDHAPRFDNVLIAAGHNMLGLSMGPATGRLVAEMVDREQTHIDPWPYRLKRFERRF